VGTPSKVASSATWECSCGSFNCTRLLTALQVKWHSSMSLP